MKPLVVAAIAVGVAAGAVLAAAQLAPAVSFSVSVSTDTGQYAQGSAARIITRVCSTSWWWGQMTAGYVNWEVVDAAGLQVADNSHTIRTADLRTEHWYPRQCRTYTTEWDLRRWNQDKRAADVVGTPTKGEALGPGRYRVRATWLSAPSGEPPRARWQAESEWFEVGH